MCLISLSGRRSPIFFEGCVSVNAARFDIDSVDFLARCGGTDQAQNFAHAAGLYAVFGSLRFSSGRQDQDDEVGEAAAFSKQHLLEEAPRVLPPASSGIPGTRVCWARLCPGSG